ncbi:dehydrogenase [Cyanobium sp. HWJ4-Hawea]|uniref:dehydrogenase n=1 Tax=unclassified Cyanobium TaxID=2627006 RepID=UPI0020CC3604|nr:MULTISPECIES: dehydrogenase [unclassified Cyanobium]MCP9776001.1 dehydrogenase [Cyanobium sp. WAJ14-Wanaka]MCP9808327.1 dehydrogenase [Cyanobium sp. HWJ4-Hawea]
MKRLPLQTKLSRFALIAACLALATGAQAQNLAASADPLLGTRAPYSKNWLGINSAHPSTEILVMAGHSDSQGVGGSGTGGAAVSLYGARPMQSGMTDELYWNLQVAQAVVALGQSRGLSMRFYDPPSRSIASGSDPRTTWSIGKAHVNQGGYAMEIHFDAYGRDGVGSGLIPPINKPLSNIDESLAAAFGAYPRNFRDGLGAPKRGIAILEVGKLEGSLEQSLRNPQTREATVAAIAERIVNALHIGLKQPPTDTNLAIDINGFGPISPPPDVVSNAP